MVLIPHNGLVPETRPSRTFCSSLKMVSTVLLVWGAGERSPGVGSRVWWRERAWRKGDGLSTLLRKFAFRGNGSYLTWKSFGFSCSSETSFLLPLKGSGLLEGKRCSSTVDLHWKIWLLGNTR